MNCYKCRAPLNEGTSICPKCGSGQSITRELVEKAISGYQPAFTQLYEMTKDDTARLLKMYIKDEDAAQDLLQESYIKAFAHLSTLREPEKFKPWVKHIARNHAVDYLRKQKPILFSQMENENGEMTVEFEDVTPVNLPEVMLDRAETTRLLDEILDTLPDSQRLVISMRYYSEIPVKEIARQLNIPEGTVKSQLNYGRSKLYIKVEELKKKGTKLYGLAPLPFLLLLFKCFNSHPAQISPSVSTNILSSVSANRPLSSAPAQNHAQQSLNRAYDQRSQQYQHAQQYRQYQQPAHPQQPPQPYYQPQNPAYGAPNAAVRTATTAAKKGIAGKIIAIILAIAIVAGGATAAYFFLNKPKKEPNYITHDYVEVYFSGSDGSGTAKAVFLTDKFEKDFIEKNGGDFNSLNIMDGKTLPIALKMVPLEMSLKVSVSPNTGLKNGDSVTVTLSYNHNSADSADVTFSADSYEVKVTGLE